MISASRSSHFSGSAERNAAFATVKALGGSGGTGHDLSIRENATRDLFDALVENRIDVAFARSAASRYPSLETVCLHNEPMVVALPTSHRLAKANVESLSMTDLAVEDFVSYRRADGPGIHDAVMAACHRAGFNAHIVEEVPRLVTAVTMAAAGRGIAIVPAALRSIHPRGVAYRDLDVTSAFTVPLNLAYRSLCGPGPVAQLLELARQLSSVSSSSVT